MTNLRFSIELQCHKVRFVLQWFSLVHLFSEGCNKEQQESVKFCFLLWKTATAELIRHFAKPLQTSYKVTANNKASDHTLWLVTCHLGTKLHQDRSQPIEQMRTSLKFLYWCRKNAIEKLPNLLIWPVCTGTLAKDIGTRNGDEKSGSNCFTLLADGSSKEVKVKSMLKTERIAGSWSYSFFWRLLLVMNFDE